MTVRFGGEFFIPTAHEYNGTKLGETRRPEIKELVPPGFTQLNPMVDDYDKVTQQGTVEVLTTSRLKDNLMTSGINLSVCDADDDAMRAHLRSVGVTDYAYEPANTGVATFDRNA